ncbi:peptide deformylase [Komagataeibacter rhaeticus]|uniref:Peptide deformylase n=1 Tax=Komagataeibacter rhaeticus TaxID=215221 RepID=A0A181CC09_9PROT|nr:peptide deformylase [Komagataeibacter rhaeticus]ATU72043.1 peptide deformylase [Komagataeibacter xylinus]QIP35832.1 peptide deformylase [Komagataeibacter rhaeticus]QOC45592.1 peptide deformylase [Komagataeibacter rhaeticus]WPP21745.1 peptide deformylase [Komagataeibacter rhaeticus]SAY49117.1 Peptide deformylase [Komagataeibacter rhaeticus]
MTLLKIARMGHPVLLQPARAVTDPQAPALRTLVADMIETMLDAQGAGLAAPQVHHGLRLFVYQVPPGRSAGEDDPPCPPAALINPVLDPVDTEMVDRLEGCLSIPGMRGWVPRYRRIAYRGINGQGQPVHGVASGFLANVLQHEYDHLDGILYPMRMPDLGRMGFDSEMARYGERT